MAVVDRDDDCDIKIFPEGGGDALQAVGRPDSQGIHMHEDTHRQEKIRAYYDEGGYFSKSAHLESYRDLFGTRLSRFRIKKLLGLYAPGVSEEVLDLGCALGSVSFSLAPSCRTITGVDYSKTAIARAKELLKTSPFDNIVFTVGRADGLKFPDDSFDLIVCADLIEHLYPEVYLGALDECRRVLRKGGKLILWTPNRGHIIEVLKNRNIVLKKDVTHVDYKDMDRILADLERRNFSILKAFYSESHLPAFSLLEKAFMRWVPLLRRRIAVVAQKE